MIDMLRTIQASDVTYRLGWTLIHSLWLGALVAGALALVLPMLQRRGALARYTAACSALIIMVVGMGCVYWMIPPRTQEPQAQAKVQFQEAEPTAHLPAIPMMAEHRASTAMAATPAVVAPHTAIAEVKVSEPLAVTANKLLAPAIPWVALVWGAGVLLLSVWQLSAWIAARRLCLVATQGAEEAILKSVSRLQKRLRVLKPVKVLRSMLVQVPMTVGWLRPVILLPASLATGLSSRQLEMLLVHELAHIRRMDYLVNLLQTLVETLLFYHPAVWYISRRIRSEREHCCDDVVLKVCGDPEEYAQTLVACSGAAAQLAMASTGGNLLTRLRRILGVNAPREMGRTWIAASLALVVVMAFMVIPHAQSATLSESEKQTLITQIKSSLQARSSAFSNATVRYEETTVFPYDPTVPKDVQRNSKAPTRVEKVFISFLNDKVFWTTSSIQDSFIQPDAPKFHRESAHVYVFNDRTQFAQSSRNWVGEPDPENPAPVEGTIGRTEPWPQTTDIILLSRNFNDLLIDEKLAVDPELQALGNATDAQSKAMEAHIKKLAEDFQNPTLQPDSSEYKKIQDNWRTATANFNTFQQSAENRRLMLERRKTAEFYRASTTLDQLIIEPTPEGANLRLEGRDKKHEWHLLKDKGYAADSYRCTPTGKYPFKDPSIMEITASDFKEINGFYLPTKIQWTKNNTRYPGYAEHLPLGPRVLTHLEYQFKDPANTDARYHITWPLDTPVYDFTTDPIKVLYVQADGTLARKRTWPKPSFATTAPATGRAPGDFSALYAKVFNHLEEKQDGDSLIAKIVYSSPDGKNKFQDERLRITTSIWKKVKAAAETVSAKHGRPITVPDTAPKIPADLSGITMEELFGMIHGRVVIPIDDDMAHEMVNLLNDTYEKERDQDQPAATTRPDIPSSTQPLPAPVQTKTRNITGKIVDPDGKPIGAAEVLLLQFGQHLGYAYPIEQATVGRAQSDATGQFTVAVAGRHDDAFIMAVARKPDIGFGYSHGIDFPSRNSEIPEIKLHKTAELTGLVVDNAGQPIANAQVRADLYRDNQNNEPDVMGCPTLDWFAAKTDKDGRFVIPGVPPEYRVEFMVKAAGRATVYTQRRPSGDNALAAQFRAGQENIRIVLAPESRIEGVALAEDSHKPVAGVKLIAMRTELTRRLSEPGTIQLGLPPDITPPAFATTDKDGHFILDGLLPGQWVVALAQQCTEGRTEPLESVAKPVLVNLAAGNSQSIPFELSAGELVEFTLVNATTGKPLKGELSPERESWLSAGWGSQISDDKGIVHMRLLPGNYRFRASDWPVPVVSGDEPSPKRLWGHVDLIVGRGKSQRLEVRLAGQTTVPVLEPLAAAGMAATTNPESPGFQVDPEVQKLIPLIKANEALFYDLEIQYQEAYKLITGPQIIPLTVSSATVVHQIRQGDLYWLDYDKHSQGADKVDHDGSYLVAYDGKVTRNWCQHAFGNLHLDRWETPFLVHPHKLISFRDEATVSEYLENGILRFVQKEQTHMRGDEGSITEEIKRLPDEKFLGRSCIVLESNQIFVGYADKKGDLSHYISRLWLAPDANYLPLKVQHSELKEGKPVLIEDAEVGGLNEIEPGIFFPKQVTRHVYGAFTEPGTLSNQRIWTLKSVRRKPQYPAERFTKVSFKDGSLVYVLRNNQIQQDIAYGSEESHKQVEELIEAASSK